MVFISCRWPRYKPISCLAMSHHTATWWSELQLHTNISTFYWWPTPYRWRIVGRIPVEHWKNSKVDNPSITPLTIGWENGWKLSKALKFSTVQQRPSPMERDRKVVVGHSANVGKDLGKYPNGKAEMMCASWSKVADADSHDGKLWEGFWSGLLLPSLNFQATQFGRSRNAKLTLFD